MLDLGKYAGAVLSAWGVTLALLALVIVMSWLQSRKAKRELEAIEARRKAQGGEA